MTVYNLAQYVYSMSRYTCYTCMLGEIMLYFVTERGAPREMLGFVLFSQQCTCIYI